MKAYDESGNEFDERFEEKWGNECPSPLPDDTNLIFDNPDEWERQKEACKKRCEEWRADCEKTVDATDRLLSKLRSLFEEESKFKEIQEKSNENLDYTLKHALIDGTVLTDEEVARREADI